MLLTMTMLMLMMCRCRLEWLRSGLLHMRR
jgi:hypothetical protein